MKGITCFVAWNVPMRFVRMTLSKKLDSMSRITGQRGEPPMKWVTMPASLMSTSMRP